MNTEVEDPPIIVMQPSASVWNSPPILPHDGFSFHTSEAMRVHDLLYPRNYPFLYVPEEAVLNDGYKLSKHRVIILPQAPYLPAKMTDALLEWVHNGGTLICTGVPGIWTPYGEDDMRIVNRVFGKWRATDTEPGKWKWKLEPPVSNSGGTNKDNTPSFSAEVIQTSYGKGSVVIAPGGFETPENREQFYNALDRAIGRRPARCANDSFELTIRAGGSGRYLCVLNPHTRDIREDAVIVAGHYAHCVDLGVGSGVPLPASVQGDETRIKLRLHPGESTILQLSAE
jgi:hypothetical protein